MKMKEHFWPVEQERRPSPIRQALVAGVREFKRELVRQEHMRKVRSKPDPFQEKA